MLSYLLCLLSFLTNTFTHNTRSSEADLATTRGGKELRSHGSLLKEQVHDIMHPLSISSSVSVTTICQDRRPSQFLFHIFYMMVELLLQGVHGVGVDFVSAVEQNHIQSHLLGEFIEKLSHLSCAEDFVNINELLQTILWKIGCKLIILHTLCQKYLQMAHGTKYD